MLKNNKPIYAVKLDGELRSIDRLFEEQENFIKIKEYSTFVEIQHVNTEYLIKMDIDDFKYFFEDNDDSKTV